MKHIHRFGKGFFVGLALAIGMAALAAPLTIPNTFTAGTTARAADVNANFAAIATAVNDGETRLTTLEARAAQPNLTPAGNLELPDSSSSTGNIVKHSRTFIHDFGVENVFAGTGAGNLTMTGRTNAGFGHEALAALTTGNRNTAAGSFALAHNTTGSFNAAFGTVAMFNNTTGAGNTAIGNIALASNTSGATNTAIGSSAMRFSTFGTSNTAVGYGAIEHVDGGHENSAFGAFALLHLQAGSNNIAIGANAGAALRNGSANIYLASPGSVEEELTVRIGSTQTRAFIAGIRGVTTANTNAIPVVVDSNGQLGTISSSRRFKDEIADMGEASSLLMRLRPVTFYYRSDQDPGGRSLQYGLVAEEVAKVAPGLVAHSRDGEVETVFYEFLPPMLLNEFQKQQRLIDAQRTRLSKLEREMTTLRRESARLAALIEREFPTTAETNK